MMCDYVQAVADNWNHLGKAPALFDSKAAESPFLALGIWLYFAHYWATLVAASCAACASSIVNASIISPAQDHPQTLTGTLPSLVLHQFAQIAAYASSVGECVKLIAVNQLGSGNG